MPPAAIWLAQVGLEGGCPDQMNVSIIFIDFNGEDDVGWKCV